MNKYVASKVAHLKRLGLVTGKSSGIGKHGGACPDWLADIQRNQK